MKVFIKLDVEDGIFVMCVREKTNTTKKVVRDMLCFRDKVFVENLFTDLSIGVKLNADERIR